MSAEPKVVLLRGINLGPNRRIPMGDLRELFGAAGLGEARTYLQSGNLVVSSEMTAKKLETESARLIAERFGFDVPAVVRTATELSQVVKLNPLSEVALEPKRYQVSFLSAPLAADRLAALQALATDSERLVAAGRELYAWHPDGVARSKLWNGLAGPGLGVKATARNWTTVTALLEMTRD